MTPVLEKGRAVVVKLGGEVVKGPYLSAICADLDLLAKTRPVVVVHGGGPQATELQKRLGQTPNVVAGRRITDAETLEVMKMTVAGQVNVDLCRALVAAGASPVGLHGASSCVVQAVKRPPRIVEGGGPDPIDFGHVGDVTGLGEHLLATLVAAGYVPVLACLGADAEGHVYNINADVVANRIAVFLDAAALVLVTDVPGVMRDLKDPASRIPKITRADKKRLVEEGIVTKGMIPKLDESFAAIAEGVRAVHVVGTLERGDLAQEIDAPGSKGTVLVA